jgi:hypothetical protein
MPRDQHAVLDAALCGPARDYDDARSRLRTALEAYQPADARVAQDAMRDALHRLREAAGGPDRLTALAPTILGRSAKEVPL